MGGLGRGYAPPPIRLTLRKLLGCGMPQSWVFPRPARTLPLSLSLSLSCARAHTHTHTHTHTHSFPFSSDRGEPHRGVGDLGRGCTPHSPSYQAHLAKLSSSPCENIMSDSPCESYRVVGCLSRDSGKKECVCDLPPHPPHTHAAVPQRDPHTAVSQDSSSTGVPCV